MSSARRLASSEDWVSYYRRNAEHLLEVPWGAGAELTPAERAVIGRSVQEFQLGESSEGRHLYQRAKAWGEGNGDPDYATAIRLFIAEEQRHARDLGRFMDLNGIPRVRSAFADSMFRKLRKLAGLEVSIRVLLTAEVVAMVYYDALREATGSAVLRRVCEQILRDEREHIRFQSERLAILREQSSRPSIGVRNLLQRALMAPTLLVVWRVHRRAYRAGGYPFRRFVVATWSVLEEAIGMSRPVNLAPLVPSTSDLA